MSGTQLLDMRCWLWPQSPPGPPMALDFAAITELDPAVKAQGRERTEHPFVVPLRTAETSWHFRKGLS